MTNGRDFSCVKLNQNAQSAISFNAGKRNKAFAMQLFVLGPAFGLPSVDPECIAATALLRLANPPNWRITPVDDQTEPLPYLAIDNGHRVHGFSNIAQHLSSHHAVSLLELDERRSADAHAIRTFLHARGQLLLDVSLYVSFENYSRTRTECSKILPWYTNFVVPPRRREDARHRTRHLGVSSIDVDDVHEDLSNKPDEFRKLDSSAGFERESKKRASVLLGGKETLMGLLRRPEHSATFKLHAMADGFFDPLLSIMDEAGSNLMRTQRPTAVDCLAYGYLSLMLFPELPQDWLAKTMRQTPRLMPIVRYTERLHQEFALQTDAEQVMSTPSSQHRQTSSSSDPSPIPWLLPQPASVSHILRSLASALTSHIPLLAHGITIVPAEPPKVSFWRRHLPWLLSSGVTALLATMYAAVASETLVWPPREDMVQIFGRQPLMSSRHLGAALGGMGVRRGVQALR